MRIASSNVSGQSASVSIEHRSASESMEIYQRGQLRSAFRYAEEETKTKKNGELFLQGQKDSFSGLLGLNASQKTEAVKPRTHKEKMSELQELKFKTLQEILRSFRRQWAPFRNVFSEQNGGLSMVSPGGGMSGMQYSAEQVRYEYARVDFAMKGQATTADGRTLSFDIELSMSREFFEQSGFAMSAFYADPNVQDPLMIQLSGMPSLSENKISFDLDMDGTLDQISFAGKGGGFLALDKNDNGIIDDGSELFGPKTGNGFEELAEYDSDSNGWIDENDPIFNRLRVWTKDQNGKDTLMALVDGDSWFQELQKETESKNVYREKQ